MAPSQSTSEQHAEWRDLYHGHGANPDRARECTICKSDLSRNDPVLRHSECDNCFHSECLENWISSVENSGSRPTCPLCRKQFEPAEQAPPVRSTALTRRRSSPHLRRQSSPRLQRFHNDSDSDSDFSDYDVSEYHDIYIAARNGRGGHHSDDHAYFSHDDDDHYYSRERSHEGGSRRHEHRSHRDHEHHNHRNHHSHHSRREPEYVSRSVTGEAMVQRAVARARDQTMANVSDRIHVLGSRLHSSLYDMAQREANFAEETLPQYVSDPERAAHRLKVYIDRKMEQVEAEIMEVLRRHQD